MLHGNVGELSWSRGLQRRESRNVFEFALNDSFFFFWLCWDVVVMEGNWLLMVRNSMAVFGF